MKPLTYATVCSGIECMSVACRGLPLKPVFFSEIEPFPCAVLKAHYPDVPNLGDMSKIQVSNDGKEITNGTIRLLLDSRLDILAGGTPCQDVSVAGKRAGMQEGSGTRSSLAFEFVRLARELGPRYIIWENVAGAIDSKNAPDFLAFLRALGDCGYSIAWRVLDAQYVTCSDIYASDGRVDVPLARAVPQRRRRVWVVGVRSLGCAGADESVPAQILFEPDCVAGHTAPRRRTGEGFAYSLAGRDRVDARLVGEPAGCEPAVARTLERRYDSSPCIDRGQNCIALDGDKLKPREDQRKGGNGFGINEEGAGYTLTAVDRHGVAYGIGHGGQGGSVMPSEEAQPTLVKDDHKGPMPAVVQCYDMTHADDPGRKVADGVSPTLQSRMGTGGNQVPLAVSTNSNGEDVAPTISSCEYKMGQKQKDTQGGVCRDTEPLGIGRDVFNSGANASYQPDIRVGVQPTLTARTTQGAVCARQRSQMSESLCYDGYNQSAHTEVSMTLRSANGGGERNDACPKVAYGINPVMSGVMMETKPAEETAQTLRKSPGGENGVVQSLGFKYKQSEKSQKPFAENGESQALSSGCHDSAVAIGFKAWQSKDGVKCYDPYNNTESEATPTIRSNAGVSTAGPLAYGADLSQMRYIVRRLTPTECERLMGLPDGYTIPTGLRRFFDANGEPSPALVAEFQRIFDTFGAIMADYAHTKPPKPKSAKQVADWLKKISDPATCPDSPRYKGCGNGWATNQPRWILTRLLALEGHEL